LQSSLKVAEGCADIRTNIGEHANISTMFGTGFELCKYSQNVWHRLGKFAKIVQIFAPISSNLANISTMFCTWWESLQKACKKKMFKMMNAPLGVVSVEHSDCVAVWVPSVQRASVPSLCVAG
jgi:hypothetical protein